MSAETSHAAPETKTSRWMSWHRRVLGFCLVVFALELGLPLVFVPWSRVWAVNLYPSYSPLLSHIWLNGFFRGALSGLGLLNIYVALTELSGQLRSLFGQGRE